MTNTWDADLELGRGKSTNLLFRSAAVHPRVSGPRFDRRANMLRANLRGQLRQTNLPRWKSLLPLFEAVMNSLQAIDDTRPRSKGKVTIEIERDPGLGLEENPPICGFKVSDTGVGFNEVNFDSFNTAYSELRLGEGGKGLGRFIWLKAFDCVEIDSVFSEPDVEGLLQRKFIFDANYDPDNASATAAVRRNMGTSVHLTVFKEPYRTECPKTAEQIAQRLIEHFVLIFLQPDCSLVEIHDQGTRLPLNQIFERDFRATASAHEFTLKDASFTLHGFRITAPRVSKHRLIYAANHRGVVSDDLGDYIPNLSGRLTDGDSKSFVYLGIVQSPYLTERVNNARTDFELGHEDAEAEQSSLLAEEIRRSDIRDVCVQFIEKDLSSIIESINSAKEKRLLQYDKDEAPQYKILMKYRNEFIDRIPPFASKVDMEAALHKELFQREMKMKQEGSRIIKEADKIDDYEEYQKRLSEFMDKYNELGVSALAQYVGHRRIILDFLERAISRKPDDGRYPLERAVHHLIFPMRTTSDDVPYYQQNLWLIDERLTYHTFISSDKPLASLKSFDSESVRRSDVFIFDRKIAFTEGEQPISSIVTIEFKRPQRDDYGGGDDPLSQSFEMIEEIRRGQFKDHRGRPISVANNRIPAYCYVVCDFTPSLHKVLKNFDAEITPDGQGYYGFHRAYGVYYEVIDYNKLLRDATKRNRIFFDKLNIWGDH